MTPGPAAVADWIEENFDLDAPPIDIAQVVMHIGDQLGWFHSPEEAAERAEAWKSRLVTRLARLINEAQATNRPYRFEFNSSADGTIQGFCFVSTGEDPVQAEAKRARSFSDRYRDHIRAHTDRDFESICRGVLKLLGCADPTLTQKSGDQGIDVFGELELTGRLGYIYHLGGPDALMNSWLAGQAKKYSKLVEVSDVYEFIGAYTLARQGVFHGDGHALKLFDPKPFQPVFLLFMTTGRLTRGAWQLANRSGIVVLDEPTICALLSDRRVATVVGLFSAVRFEAWTAGKIAV